MKEVIVEDIEKIIEPDIRTYDIQVEDNHTFFADGILTHNSEDEGGDGIPGDVNISLNNQVLVLRVIILETLHIITLYLVMI